MKCLQCGAGVTGNFCAYCKTATLQGVNKPENITKTHQTMSDEVGSNQSEQVNRNAKLIEGYNQQIQKINKMMIPDNIKQVKIKVIKKKIDALNA